MRNLYIKLKIFVVNYSTSIIAVCIGYVVYMAEYHGVPDRLIWIVIALLAITSIITYILKRKSGHSN